ncbi:MAG: hypothetical protein LC104_15155 [Bacteroidales bacterium]|nr:hypothetical protein [Bacteroidales bacterium]
MPDTPPPTPRIPVVTLLAAFLALGLFVGATALVYQWKPGPERTAVHPPLSTEPTP